MSLRQKDLNDLILEVVNDDSILSSYLILVEDLSILL